MGVNQNFDILTHVTLGVLTVIEREKREKGLKTQGKEKDGLTLVFICSWIMVWKGKGKIKSERVEITIEKNFEGKRDGRGGMEEKGRRERQRLE